MQPNPYEAPKEPSRELAAARRPSWFRDKFWLLVIGLAVVAAVVGPPYIVARWIIGP
ncbi:MAG: hypothetical protein L0211_21395 [Planctomycetaceae bacterium]|nr:hypothetical protein [Planctomycetaceae bacterium]